MSPNAGGGKGVAEISANEYSCAHGAQINFGDLTPYLPYGWGEGPFRVERDEVNLNRETVIAH